MELEMSFLHGERYFLIHIHTLLQEIGNHFQQFMTGQITYLVRFKTLSECPFSSINNFFYIGVG